MKNVQGLFILMVIFIIPIIYSTLEPFSGTMVTNIQHHPDHKRQKHTSREHPGSNKEHTHSKSATDVRFNTWEYRNEKYN